MAIRAASDRILAHVEFITTAKEGEFGVYKSILFLRTDLEGEAAKVWKSIAVDQADRFVKGQPVFLVPAQRKGKDTWDIELIDDSAALPAVPSAKAILPTVKPQSEAQSLSTEQKRAIAQYLDSRADLLQYCFQITNQKLAALDPHSQRAAAIELYRSATQKFNL